MQFDPEDAEGTGVNQRSIHEEPMSDCVESWDELYVLTIISPDQLAAD